jgi:hypothetical protein
MAAVVVQPDQQSHRLPSQLATVPFGGICGYAPGGIAAFSNGSDTHFSNESNYDGHFFTGYKWQCVEFARRWLLERKGLVLPLYFFAAHIIYGKEVATLDDQRVEALVVRNGHSTEPPEADSLIIYPSTRKNVVGHVGVITHVGLDFVRVADQNRYFHYWGDKDYSAEFPLVKRSDGTYVIEDPDGQCSGWISFPGFPNRPDGVKLIVPSSLKSAPKSWIPRHLYFVWKGIEEHYWGVNPPTDKKTATENEKKSAVTCCFFKRRDDVAEKRSEDETSKTEVAFHQHHNEDPSSPVPPAASVTELDASDP